MNPEEFLDFIRKSDREIKEARKLEKALKKRLSEELFNFIFAHYTSYEPYRTSLSAQLKIQCDYCSSRVLDMLSIVISSQESGQPFKGENRVPKVKSKSESQKELQTFIAQIKEVEAVTEEDLAYAEEIHWEDYADEIKHQQFKKGLHDKAKDILVEFYEEDILALEGDYLRMLDSYTYQLAISWFIEMVYDILPTLEQTED